MSYSVDCVVIGAGVVGLAVARSLARANREVLVLERERMIGSGTSSRSSEVIHAGLYYPTGSLKARLCIAGREALYSYCASHGVGNRRCGKLVVATQLADADYLERLQAKAHANGVDDVRLLSGNEVRALEPAVAAVAGLLSPSTGIIDSHTLMHAYRGDAEERGAVVALKAPLLKGVAGENFIRLHIGGDDPTTLDASLVINAAGLHAWEISAGIDGLDKSVLPPMALARGVYFTLSGRAPFTHLIYPVPEPGGLGIHLTLDLAGQARFGPDVEWIDSIDYGVDGRRAELFYAAIRRYWPDLPGSSLQPGYAGIRPKVAGPGAPDGDFVVQGPLESGHPGYIALYGIESPGLTASLAIAELVATLAEGEGKLSAAAAIAALPEVHSELRGKTK